MCRRRVVVFSIVVLLLASPPAWAGDGCPAGWTPVGTWYQEDNTCKLCCIQPGQEAWWMDSGGESRPGCEAPQAPAPGYFDLWGYSQAPLSDCPDGWEPEHVWFEQDGTCLLECVNKETVDLPIGLDFDWRGWLDIPLDQKQVYIDSHGESRPPWCILED